MRWLVLPKNVGRAVVLVTVVGVVSTVAIAFPQSRVGAGIFAMLAILLAAAILRRVDLNREHGIFGSASLLVLSIVALSTFSSARNELPVPSLLDGWPAAMASLGIAIVVALGAWEIARHRAVEHLVADADSLLRAEQTANGVAILRSEGPAYREEPRLVALVPLASARSQSIRLHLGGALVLLALFSSAAFFDRPSAFEVTGLRRDGERSVDGASTLPLRSDAHVARLAILRNSMTGTGDHVCAIWSDGKASCSGYWADGFRRLTSTSSHEHVEQIAGAHYELDRGGHVFREGTAPSGLSALDNVDAVQIIGYQGFGVCARARDGHVHCVAGDAPENCDPSMPRGGTIASLDDAVDLATTDVTTCAARKNGELRCWSTCDASRNVTLPPIANVVQIVDGSPGFCVRLNDGAVKCQRSNDWVSVPNVRAAAGLASSWGATCAWTNEGQVWCWGTSVDRVRDVWPPRQLPMPAGFDHLVVGDDHICFTVGDVVDCFGHRN